MGSMKSDLVDIYCLIIIDRPKAVLINTKDTGDPHDTDCWLPKSKIEIEYTGKAYRGKAYAVVTLPAWLATEKGLA